MKYTLLALLLGISCSLFGQYSEEDMQAHFYNNIVEGAWDELKQYKHLKLDTTFMRYAVLMPVRETTDTVHFIVSYLEFDEDATILSTTSKPLSIYRRLLPDGNMANFMVPMFVSIGQSIEDRFGDYQGTASLGFFSERGYNVPLLEPERLGYRVGLVCTLWHVKGHH